MRLSVAVSSLLLSLPVSCTQLRYSESFVPEGEVRRVEIHSDAGVVELVGGLQLRVDRGVRGPEGAVSVAQRVEDGVLYLESRCSSLVPCAVDTTLNVPVGVPVSVWLGSGEVWSTGVDNLNLDLGKGQADLEVRESLFARVGTGDLVASLGDRGTARITVADGDLGVTVPRGPWRVDADGSEVSVQGVTEDAEAPGGLELLAPAGRVSVGGV